MEPLHNPDNKIAHPRVSARGAGWLGALLAAND
jgi:hypothetical protein